NAGLFLDGIIVRDKKIITHSVALHELGHSLQLLLGDSTQVGHKSGPGAIWALPLAECGKDPITGEVDYKKFKDMKRSYYWGDHIFIFRLAPIIP
ncbi:hypothetical protein KKB99_01420, partial [bacterium]|nr:hypothetical protein [bacterium]MBU1024645.1 hypothetical protein [bacterium]